MKFEKSPSDNRQLKHDTENCFIIMFCSDERNWLRRTIKRMKIERCVYRSYIETYYEKCENLEKKISVVSHYTVT